MIPKILHYCWFGRNPLPDSVKKCIASWKRYCPEYKIRCWNEENFDIDSMDYVREAYASGKYAFVADVARLHVLNQYGGFYLDTDVELVQGLDKLCVYEAVSGFEEGNYLQTAFIGSVPGGEWVRYLLTYYDGRKFLKSDGTLDVTTNVSTITDMTESKYQLVRSNTEQDLSVVHVFPKEYFSPKSFSNGLTNCTKNTVCIHHFDSTWTGSSARAVRMHRYKIYRFFGKELGRKVLSFEEVCQQQGFTSAIGRIFKPRIKDAEKPKRVLLYGHTGSNNHGCEALARTVPLALPGMQVDLISTKPEIDRRYGVPIENIIRWENSMTEFSPKWFLYKISEKLLHSKKLCNTIDTNQRMLKQMRSGYDAVFAIGGDNYCYNQGKPYHKLDSDLHKTGIKNGLLGCSLEPEDLKGELGRHLRNFDVITTRESITYEAVKATGHPNVHLIPDTAFVLPTVTPELPDNWQAGNTIGLNFSPLSLSYARNRETTKAAIRGFIEYLYEKTDCTLAFIAHVYKDKGGDWDLMQELMEGLNPKRVVAIYDDNLNCMQIKGYISQCRMFIGARTHATIAAYSSCVPTLVIGYSVKSRGIARDLFGTEDGYILPIERISQTEDLIQAYEKLHMQEDGIRAHLKQIMPEYISQISRLQDALFQ